MHLDIILSLRANADLTSPGPPAFVCNENLNQSDSDYESDHRPEIAEGRAASSAIDHDMQNDSDAEDVSHPPVCGRSSSQETISGASRALSDVARYMERNRPMTDDSWNTFSSEDDFNLASWLVLSEVAKSEIDVYFAEGLGGTDSRSFESAHTMRQNLDVLEPFGEYLVWTEAVIDDGRHAATFLLWKYYQLCPLLDPPGRVYIRYGLRTYSGI